jgi:hypothetical protein
MATVDGGEQNPGGTQNQPGAGENQPNPAQNTPSGVKPDAQQQQQQLQTPAEKTFSFKEDRSDWIPRTRLNEESGKRTKIETENATLKQQLEQAEKRVRAALGIETPSQDQQDAAEVKERVVSLLSSLTPEERAKLFPEYEEVRESAAAANAAQQAQWERHANALLSDLEDEASDQLGVEKLSEAQAKRIRRAFREEAREAAHARAEAARTQDSTYDFRNDFVARYERGDKTLLSEFASSFIKEWGIPARRSTVASEVRRGNRPVPRGERQRAPMTQTPPKINYNDDAAFKAAMTQARNGGGEV